MPEPALTPRIEEIVRTYIQACNDADANAIAACFTRDGAQYTPLFAWKGAETVGANFAQMVRAQGTHWTVDQVVVDVDRCQAVLEWTMFNRQPGWLVRGVDWFVFERQTLRIEEIRSYFASWPPGAAERSEMADFDYAGRGYPTPRPAER